MRQFGTGARARSQVEGLARRLDPPAFSLPLSPRFSMLMRRRAALERAEAQIVQARSAASRMRTLLRRKASLDAEVRTLAASLERHASLDRVMAARTGLLPRGEPVSTATASAAMPANDDHRRAQLARRRARSASELV